MTVAETLADMVITTRAADLPDRAMDLAAMVVASAIARAAAGRVSRLRGSPSPREWGASGADVGALLSVIC